LFGVLSDPAHERDRFNAGRKNAATRVSNRNRKLELCAGLCFFRPDNLIPQIAIAIADELGMCTFDQIKNSHCPSPMFEKNCHGADSNCQPGAYETPALTV